MSEYVELHCHSAYSLLDGASTVQALVAQAVALGMPALALTDHDALYGAVPFVEAARGAGVRPILGAELTMADGYHLTLLVEDEAGWSNLCQLVSAARPGASWERAAVQWDTLAACAEGLVCLTGCRRGPVAAALLAWDRQGAFRAARRLGAIFPGRLYVELQHHLGPDDGVLVDDLHRLAGYLGLPTVATNNVHYARRDGRRLQDMLSTIKCRVTLEEATPTLRPNDEYYLKPHWRLRPLFSLYPDALASTLRIADRCRYELRFGLNDLPLFPTPPGCDALGYLGRLCADALGRRYGEVGEAAHARLRHELRLINCAGLANYFLIVWDIVRFAGAAGIRCQGRGSAASSLVAYLLGISPLDPLRHQLVGEVFLGPGRRVLPDVALDVDAARREEVIQYLYARYGASHVALACSFITFQARSALADIARALGADPAAVREAELDLDGVGSPGQADPAVDLILELCRQAHGLPRQLGWRGGGVVVMGPPIAERVPTEPVASSGRSVTQWDEEALGLAGVVKIDVVGLSALSVVAEAVRLMADGRVVAPDFARCAYDDPEVYAALAAGDTLGVFEVESRALSKLLRRLRPACLGDLIAALGGVDSGHSRVSSPAFAVAAIIYQHAWLKRYAPAPFYIALLNNQPVGLWPPGVLVGDAKRHGVRLLKVDINRSNERCTIEEGAIRIGLGYVGGLGERGAVRIMNERDNQPFVSLRDFCHRTGLPQRVVERLILAGALDCLGGQRRTLLAELGGLRYAAERLDPGLRLPKVNLAPLTLWEQRRQEEAVLGLCVGEHALTPLRSWLAGRGISSGKALHRGEAGTRVETAGVLVARQTPSNADRALLLTLEDEHGLIDVVLRPSVAGRYGPSLVIGAILRVVGMLRQEAEATSVLAWHVEPLETPLL